MTKSPADQLARLLAPNAKRDTPARQLQLRSAVVQTVDPVGWTATVLFGASTTPAGPIPCAASYFAVVGDVVQVLVASSASMLILGPPAPTPWQTSISGSLTAVTTNPTGWSAATRWSQQGKTLLFASTFTLGSGFGSGAWIFNLGIDTRVPVVTALFPQICHGYYDAKGDGTIRTTIAGIISAATTGIEVSRTIGNATNLGIGSGSAAWAAGGTIHFAGAIEVV